MNTNATTCARCGSTIEAHGLCPKCLMSRAAMLTEDDTLPASTATPRIDEVAAALPELEVLEVIGRGGMGVVYKARQKSLNRLVALKLLAPERVTDPQFAERFTKEAQALAALSHPNIVTVHDFGEAGGFYFLLMEFVDGVNLRQAMTAGRFTPEQALAIVPPVCEALQYAHDHGIVHRDIKPENLLLDKEGRLKIADFGIAKIVERTSKFVASDAGETNLEVRSTMPLGTPRYMAPEQGGGDARVDHRADIYSLGVVLYELLTGELPTTKMEPPSQRVQIDVRLDEVVLRALSVQPDLRWQTASEMKTQVATIVRQPPVAVHKDRLELLYQALGFFSPLARRLTSWSLLGFLCLAGFVPGLAFMRWFMGFFSLLLFAVVIEKMSRIVNGEPPRRWSHVMAAALLFGAGIALPLQAWVLRAFIIPTNSMSPELPAGSRVLVWRLGHHFAPGDIVVHLHDEKHWVGRVARVEAGQLMVTRNNAGEESVPLDRVVGKVISVYWRAPASASAAPPSTGIRFIKTPPKDDFTGGDNISVTSWNQLPDGSLTVSGTYVLQSADEANLCLYITSSARSGLDEQTQRKHVTKGSGSFELKHRSLVPGDVHVSFYSGKQVLGHHYFGRVEGELPSTPPASPPKTASKAKFTNPFEQGDAWQKLPVKAQVELALRSMGDIANMKQGQRYELVGNGKPLAGYNDDFLRLRTGREIIESGLSCGCGDNAFAFIEMLEPAILETLVVEGAAITLHSLEHNFDGHVIVAVRKPGGDKWLLADPSSRKLITEDWPRDSKSFYDGRFWIGYVGTLADYPVHSPEELRQHLRRILTTVPREHFNKVMAKFRFKLDPSLFGPNGKALNANVERLSELQDRLLGQFDIHPEREIDVLLVNGADDYSGAISFDEAKGWICTVGQRSGCSSGFIDYMNGKVLATNK